MKDHVVREFHRLFYERGLHANYGRGLHAETHYTASKLTSARSICGFSKRFSAKCGPNS